MLDDPTDELLIRVKILQNLKLIHPGTFHISNYNDKVRLSMLACSSHY